MYACPTKNHILTIKALTYLGLLALCHSSGGVVAIRVNLTEMRHKPITIEDNV